MVAGRELRAGLGVCLPGSLRSDYGRLAYLFFPGRSAVVGGIGRYEMQAGLLPWHHCINVLSNITNLLSIQPFSSH